MKKHQLLSILALTVTMLACNLSSPAPTATLTAIPASATATEIPATPTLIPTETPIPGEVVLDFTKQLCNAKWMNGGQKFEACPDPIGDISMGYATLIDPATEGISADLPVLLTIPATNGYAALFLRYPALKIEAGDRFRATLQCQASAPQCDVSFGLDYYDANGKYHSPLVMWDYHSGQQPLIVDFDLSQIAGQNVDLVLALRPNNATPEGDLALWVNPQVFRPTK